MTITLITTNGHGEKGDLLVVNAARVSFAKEKTSMDESDVKLIKYLAKHNHWTPFSHSSITLRIKMPIFVARQWFKHMVGFTRNEVSRRYVDFEPEFWAPDSWRGTATDKKQGSSDEEQYELTIEEGIEEFTYEDIVRICNDWYAQNDHICPEQRRAVLPQSMMTEFIETGSLAAYARLAGLRNQPDAQKEIQEYALEVDKIMKDLYPVSWEALTNQTKEV